MTGPEQGFLLLTSSLGDPERKPLTIAQFRTLAKRVQAAERDVSSRDLTVEDLLGLGYDPAMAEHIFSLLSGTNQLREYLHRAENCDCYPITRLNPVYPHFVHRRLGLDSPGVLWAKGDVTLLNRPAVAVIGSRELRKENQSFAEEAGGQIASQGYVLVSGNARGADRTAQEACLSAGGNVICVVADALSEKSLRRNMLFVSEDSFDLPFSPQRAISRNRVIHSLGAMTVVAQCTLGTGGTWGGTVKNLQNHWSPVFVFDDGRGAMMQLMQMGAEPVTFEQISDFRSLFSGVKPLI